MKLGLDFGRRTRQFLKLSTSSTLWIGLLAALHLNGCLEGGTSTEAGNPGLTLQLNTPVGEPEFHGTIQFFAANSNPTFIANAPGDGDITLGPNSADDKTSVLAIANGKTPPLSLDFISQFINGHSIQPLFKANGIAPVAPLPDFNIVISGTGTDSTVGCVVGIGYDTVTGMFRYQNGANTSTAEIEMTFGKNYHGTIDTAGIRSPALGLFVPGTPYYAAIVNDSFHFKSIPKIKLPLRLISQDGLIYGMQDSLGSTWTHALKTTGVIDRTSMPKPYPKLNPPVAAPLGQYAFTDSVAIQLTAQKNALIYFSLDGRTPTKGSTLYANPIILRASATLKAVAYLVGSHHSEIVVNNYTLVPAAPLAIPTGKVFQDSLLVRLTSAQRTDTIFYTLDGTVPDKNSLKYTSPITLKISATLKAITYQAGLGLSATMEEKYVAQNPPVP